MTGPDSEGLQAETTVGASDRWAVDLMDCGRDDGVQVCETWEKADSFRQAYVAAFPACGRVGMIHQASPGTRLGYHDPAPHLDAAEPSPVVPSVGAVPVEVPEVAEIHDVVMASLQPRLDECDAGWVWEVLVGQFATVAARVRAEDGQDIATLFRRYVAARGLAFTISHPNGRKLAEDGVEYAIEVAAGNLTAARLELADVVLAAARQAELLGTTVELCIAEKTEADRGRG